MEHRVSKGKSITYGIMAFILGAIISSVISSVFNVTIPFLGFIVAIVFYFKFAKPKGANLTFFILGYFLLAIIVAMILAVAIVAIFSGGVP